MNENYEQEIDLKWLLYRVLRAFREIVLWAVIIGIVVGLGNFALNMIKISDSEYIEEERLNFEREHASWVSVGENLQAEIENLEDTREKQIEYNEKSVLMQINPLREYNASFELYVDYDYQIMPGMSYQNIDLSDRILKAYATYMANGELYQYIIDNLSYELELRYLKEILGISVDYNNNMISVSVRQQNAEMAQELLDLVQAGLTAKFEDINSGIGEHKLTMTNSAAYEAVNLSLEEKQKENIQSISKLNVALQEKNEEYQEWKKEPEPKEEYTIVEMIKNAVKLLIIGGVIAGVVIAVMVAFASLMSGRLLNPQELKHRFGLRIVGELPQERVKKPFACIARFIASFGGITVCPEDYDKLAKTIGAGIKSDLSSGGERKDWKKIAFTGMVSEEELQKVIEDLKLGEPYLTVCAPDVLTRAESVEKVAAADCVVLVEKQEQTMIADVEKELESLKAWNKTVLGAIVLNTDARM
ncbi:MAG: hypothetical protein ACI4FZ_00130 [Lachnospiraceae bacterium]